MTLESGHRQRGNRRERSPTCPDGMADRPGKMRDEPRARQGGRVRAAAITGSRMGDSERPRSRRLEPRPDHRGGRPRKTARAGRRRISTVVAPNRSGITAELDPGEPEPEPTIRLEREPPADETAARDSRSTAVARPATLPRRRREPAVATTRDRAGQGQGSSARSNRSDCKSGDDTSRRPHSHLHPGSRHRTRRRRHLERRRSRRGSST